MPLGAFVIAMLAMNFAPGPDMTYVAGRSLGQGRRAGVISALGIGVGCLFHVALAAAGVAVVLRAQSRRGRLWFQRASGVMLMVLGLRLALARTSP